ncbi:hypothetical protein [Ancylobacter sp. SL191]|jgi:hypothetical protein|uniref:hypothetical protein n=1 Tax=Ancylobacter sp. SL191 TaxID=2995166 RepID=UPI0022720037|nr:hypothetical protein [Ancylobacter sp. SL191]WAC25767.1 hypothetical protein OU996_12075 [Ancylobacter sp. SL191]
MKHIIIALLLSLGMALPASAQYYGGASWGDWNMIPQRSNGNQVFNQASQAGALEIWHHKGGTELDSMQLRSSIGKRQVELTGVCESGCGLVVLSLPKNQVCIGRSAEIALHATRPVDGLRGDKAAWALADSQTRANYASLPSWAREKARAAFAPQSRDWVVFSRGELIAAGYKPCSGK